MAGSSKPNGPAVAAILAASSGCASLGILTTAATASDAFAKAITLSSAVGPLSGKTTGAVIAWAIAWVVLWVLWKGQSVDFRKVWPVAAILVAVGFIGTFPPFFDLF